MDVQEEVNIWNKYATVLKGKKPADFEECPGIDAPWYWQRRKDTGINEPFPGLQMHKVFMGPFNAQKHPLDRRQLIMYREIGSIPRDPNMHLCAHLYASDRNSLYIVANHFDIGNDWTQMSSLVHTVIFHADMDDLWFQPGEARSELDTVDGRWFCKEDWSDRVAAGRAMFHSKVWSANGKHVATMMQDGMIRVTKKPKASLDEVRAMELKRQNWMPREKL
jgi:hypothetical protein